MDTIKFKACYEAPYFSKSPVLPWKVAKSKPFHASQLSADMTHEQLGLFVAAFAQYGAGGESISGMDKDEIIELILQRESPVIAGGIAVLDEASGDGIFPGCCCGLEGWRDWFEFLTKDYSPWMGHDPSPWMERTPKGGVTIWADGGLDEPKQRTGSGTELTEAAFKANLQQVERDLLGFLDALQAWAEAEGITKPGRLVNAVDKAFTIRLRPAYMQEEWWQKYCEES